MVQKGQASVPFPEPFVSQIRCLRKKTEQLRQHGEPGFYQVYPVRSQDDPLGEKDSILAGRKAREGGIEELETDAKKGAGVTRISTPYVKVPAVKLKELGLPNYGHTLIRI